LLDNRNIWYSIQKWRSSSCAEVFSSQFFGGGSKPAAPPPPPASPKEPPKRADESVRQARDDEKRRRSAAGGFRGTLLSPDADLGQLNIRQSTLLGGARKVSLG
jgi:hypothetical protein